MRYTSILNYILLGVAWSLLFISAPLPLAGLDHGGNEYVLRGFEVGVLAPCVGLVNLVDLVSGTGPGEQYVSIPLFFSDLLFVTSLLVLLKFRSGHLSWKRLYLTLNVACLALLALPVTQVTRHVEPGNGAIQLLPGLLVWFGAQLALTLFAGIELTNALPD